MPGPPDQRLAGQPLSRAGRPEGKLTGPRGCNARPPGPNRELTAPDMRRVGVDNLWLRRSHHNVLLSNVEAERNRSTFTYADCGVIPFSGCGRGF